MELDSNEYTNTDRPPALAGRQKGVSGSTLKLIAVISMLIDHFAAGVLGRYLSLSGINQLDSANTSAVSMWMEQNGSLFYAYSIMRNIGRLAFPIYCFLLVEGFEHTKDRRKYAGRLLLFAAISEIPFDLLFNGSFLEFGYQNVFFTLFLGLLSMIGLNYMDQQENLAPFLKSLFRFGIIAICMLTAQLLFTDYAAIGVLCVTVLYLFRKTKPYQIIAGCIAFFWELTALLAFIPIWFYNGSRGWNLKYFFYLFYPLHLLLLYLLCIVLGIASYPAL